MVFRMQGARRGGQGYGAGTPHKSDECEQERRRDDVAAADGGEESVYGDSDYVGAEKRKDAIRRNRRGKKIRYKIN